MSRLVATPWERRSSESLPSATWSAVLWLFVVVAFGVAVANVGTNFPGPSNVQPNGQLTDATRDWLSARAAVDGDPYRPLSDLAGEYLPGVSSPDGFVHPRTPGALLMQVPLLAVPPEWAWPVMVWLGLVSVGVVAWAATRIAGVGGPWVAVVGCAMLLSRPGLAAILVGSQGPVVAALIGVAWLQVARRDGFWPGVWVGLAAVLKMFPLLLIPLLWFRRRRAAAAAAAVFAGLNVAGLLLPGVTVGGSIGVLVDQPNVGVAWNLSPELPVAAVAAVGVVLVWTASRWSLPVTLSVGCVAMLALSPVVWAHYLFVLAFPAAWVVRTARSRASSRTG